ncbi:MAG TPA: hypothetical protein VMH92_04465 [Acidocella sp.]|nr:hypothetical protein [Acidocella sp.]
MLQRDGALQAKMLGDLRMPWKTRAALIRPVCMAVFGLAHSYRFSNLDRRTKPWRDDASAALKSAATKTTEIFKSFTTLAFVAVKTQPKQTAKKFPTNPQTLSHNLAAFRAGAAAPRW